MPEAAVHLGSGKVRELYALDDERLLLVASDRISTFDVILPTEVPDKGRVLTGLSAFWFARTRELVPNHLLALRDDGRSLECRRLDMLPVEIVVRGYLAGSGWKDYRQDRRRLRPPAAGGAARVRPPAGADRHAGDEGAVRPRREHRRAGSGQLVGAERWAEVESVALALYRFAAAHAEAARDHPRRHEVRARHRQRWRARAR